MHNIIFDPPANLMVATAAEGDLSSHIGQRVVVLDRSPDELDYDPKVRPVWLVVVESGVMFNAHSDELFIEQA